MSQLRVLYGKFLVYRITGVLYYIYIKYSTTSLSKMFQGNLKLLNFLP